MDYEKKYKEALGWMQGVYPTLTGAAREDAEHFFPELAESEDEKIRKEIIDYLGLVGKGKGDYAQPMIDRWIAYLEKQKEQKKDNPLEDFSRGYNAGYYHGITDSEQKPAQTETEKQYVHTLKALVSDFIRDRNPEDVPYYQGIFDWLDGRHIERQPAEWSEEDENNLELVIDCIYKFYPDPVMKYKLKEWLKSLRPTKDCSDCAKHLEGYISGRSAAENKLLEQFGALITPEDELHIKPRWKPSKEQMEALSDAYVEASTFKNWDILESLYDDLEKLT